MPTQPGIPGTPLDAKSAVAKFASLITDNTVEDDSPATPEPAAEKPAEATPPTPPEAPPPEPSESDDQAPDDEPMYEVQVDGEPVEVSLTELKKSYSYQGHNTRKAQELAEKEKRLEPEIRSRLESEVVAERQQLQQGIAEVRQALDQMYGEPDWSEVRKLGDAEYLKQRADWEESKVARNRLKAKEAELARQNAETQQKALLQYLRAEEDKLKTAIPEWTDLEKGKTELTKLRTFAKQQYGFSDQEVQNGFSSAAIVLLVRDAMKYRELQREPSAQVKAKVAPIKTAKPGTPVRPRPNERQQKLLEQTKSGRQRDAMAAIEAMLD